jgi:hypothetical protein
MMDPTDRSVQVTSTLVALIISCAKQDADAAGKLHYIEVMRGTLEALRRATDDQLERIHGGGNRAPNKKAGLAPGSLVIHLTQLVSLNRNARGKTACSRPARS